MMKRLLFLLLLYPLLSLGQGDQTIINVTVGGGVTQKTILHLPNDYNTTSTKYPLIIFIHGAGEAGSNPADIYTNSESGGPSYYIAQGSFPTSFTNPADGQQYKFIIASPQYATSASPTTGMQLDSIIGYLAKNYRVDTSRVFFTGLSDGGIGQIENIGRINTSGTAINPLHQVAASVPMSAVMNAGLRSSWAPIIVKDSVHVWAFGSPTDTHGANTQGLVFFINQVKSNWAKFTSYSGGHCCWGQFYDPDYKETINGVSMNIYEWMLQYRQKGYVPPVKDSSHWLIQVLPTEYKCFYRSADSNLWAMYWDNDIHKTHLIKVKAGGRKFLGGAGGLYNLYAIASDSTIWMTDNQDSNATQIETDTSGAAFNHVVSLGVFNFTYAAIKDDGKLWYGGIDNFKVFYSSGTATIKPTLFPNQPSGKKCLKVQMSVDSIVVLMTTGEIYCIGKGSTTWNRRTGLGGPATDISISYQKYYIAIVPTDTSITKSGYPVGWGDGRYLGLGNITVTTPVDLTDTWGLTSPIREICSNQNVTHYLTDEDSLYGIGSNTGGEVGVGWEIVNQYTYATKYTWNWVRGTDMVTPPVNVGNGLTYKHLSYPNNSSTFYSYAIGQNDSLYMCGRTKSSVGATPEQASNEADYPNYYDRTSFTQVHPWDVVFDLQTFVPGTVDVGDDQSITVGNATITATSTPSTWMTDASYAWTSDCSSCTIVSPTSLSTTVTGLSDGTYKFKLVVTDNNGATTADSLNIAVALSAPTVDAGSNHSITLPTSTVSLTGTASGNGGATISSVLWTQDSGPSTATIVSATSLSTSINNLEEGTYVFRLTATDSNDQSNYDTVQVIVSAASPSGPRSYIILHRYRPVILKQSN